MIDLKAKVVRSGKMPFRMIETDGLIMNPKDSNLHSLNETASFLWEQIEQPQSVEALIQNVLKRFQVDRQRAEQDVLKFVEEIQTRGLINIVD
jgi:hypothetical protein